MFPHPNSSTNQNLKCDKRVFSGVMELWMLTCPITAELPLRCHLERRAEPEVETRRATEGRISQIAEFPFICKGILVLPRDPNALHLPYGFRLRQTRSVFLSRSKMTHGGAFCGTERTAIPLNFVVTRPTNQNLNNAICWLF